MKTKEKLEYINHQINDRLNKRLKHRTFKVEFENFGANRYCLKLKDKLYKFNTYDDMISCLDFIDDMFENAIKEIEETKESK